MTAFASPGCTAINNGNWTLTSDATISDTFAAGDKLTFTVNSGSHSRSKASFTGALGAGGTLVAPTGARVETFVATAGTGTMTLTTISGAAMTVQASSCVPASGTSGGTGGSSGGTGGSSGGTGTSTDSANLRSLENGITKSASSVSGQVVSTAVDGAIDNAFSGGGAPLSFSSNGVSINFAAMPKSDVERRTDAAFSALAYAGVPTKAPRELALDREWSAWLDLRGTGWQNHDVNVGATGGQFNLTGGIGRKLTADLLVGVYSGYQYFKYDFASVAGNMKGAGGTIGGYVGWRVTPTLRLDATLGYTRMAYSGTTGTATGSFNGNRLMLSSGLTGSYGIGAYRIEPSASIYVLWEKQDAWTDSLGTAQSAHTFSNGRTSLGGKLMRPLAYDSVTLTPYVGFYGDWYFSADNFAAGDSVIVAVSDGWSGRATAGVGIVCKNNVSLAVSGELGGLGADYKIWTGSVRAKMPF